MDRRLFRGTAYKAKVWEALGYSSGFKRVSEDIYQRHDRPKELWVKGAGPAGMGLAVSRATARPFAPLPEAGAPGLPGGLPTGGKPVGTV